MPDFDLLKAARKEVGEFLRLHAPSLEAFRAAPEKAWFKIDVEEPPKDVPVSHKTTSASCVESLADLVSAGHFEEDALRALASEFATNALDQPDGEWQSEGAAWVYCRARTLPSILTYSDKGVIEAHKEALEGHIRFIWEKVDLEPRRQAVYERAKPEETEEKRDSPEYPPNAFHTFWALRTLYLARRFPQLEATAKKYEKMRRLALLWAQNMLATQIALYDARSDRADPQQLAWALAAQFVDPEHAREDELSAGELYRSSLFAVALDVFFNQQLESGSWPLGQPIFHYPDAGNAYCYVYETLTELLRPALQSSGGRPYRDLLRPHLPNLLRAWEFARTTAIPLRSEDAAVGWCSSHHPHRTYPEGWATAVAFSFLQCFRRLLGIWARDEAARELGARPAAFETKDRALDELGRRGRTWAVGERWSAGEQLAALFLHPINASHLHRDHEDPDMPLIASNQARSAILFGPPGTSKTTLAEALAGAVGWDFVEIHASDFLSQGMNQVPGRAEEIFSRLMELDHCVILFDEIDELVRERKLPEADPFGRFLTTSMLPKLARLWNQRRVLFFVAMNNISEADDAIKRSQRFDAAVFVGPPSFEVKREVLEERFGDKCVPFTAQEVEADLAQAPNGNPLGVFALLRWDQIGELGDLMEDHPKDAAHYEVALRHLGEHMLHPGGGSNIYKAFCGQREQERRDHRDVRIIWAEGKNIGAPGALSVFKAVDGGAFLQLGGSDARPPESLPIDGKDVSPDHLLRYR